MIAQRRYISIHAPHEGERLSASALSTKETEYFNPRSPRGGATAPHNQVIQAVRISIHAPHEGERHHMMQYLLLRLLFQSTLPTRGSDGKSTVHRVKRSHFNPRSPRGGATQLLLHRGWDYGISIHAPHEGERPSIYPVYLEQYNISIHAPHEGERHKALYSPVRPFGISIHAPHEGERRHCKPRLLSGCCISIHAPHEGERPFYLRRMKHSTSFQSTLPTRGSDCAICMRQPFSILFQSTLPTRGSDHRLEQTKLLQHFISIHAPHEGERRIFER